MSTGPWDGVLTVNGAGDSFAMIASFGDGWHLVYGENNSSLPSDREANKELLPAAGFTQVQGADHFIALERPDILAELLNASARPPDVPACKRPAHDRDPCRAG
jgi:pimeloyl-ACP methyl ester carboxylesterase